jgi:uracil-DNA glycosylase
MQVFMNAKLYKQALLDQLYAPYKKCTQCPLGMQGRSNVVFGEGNPDAKLMFIGEGPGANNY